MEITSESIFTQSKELCDDLVSHIEMRRKLTRLAVYALVASAVYGVTMGAFHSWQQALASAIKVPMLFLLTLVTCLPTLHFVGLLFGSPVRFSQSSTILMSGICQTCVLLGAFAPISLFFFVSRSSYPFLLFMHVAIFAFCGAAGLASVNKNFKYVRSEIAGERPSLFADQLLKVWMLLYMFVGTQMAFNLAPFINKGGPVTVINKLNGNFYTYLWDILNDRLKN